MGRPDVFIQIESGQKKKKALRTLHGARLSVKHPCDRDRIFFGERSGKNARDRVPLGVSDTEEDPFFGMEEADP